MAEFVAKAALFNERNELLLLRRALDDDNRPGDFDFPGGGVEPGESCDAAMVREIHEEIGVWLSTQDLHQEFSDTSMKDGKNVIRCLFIGKVPNDTKITLSGEHSWYSWLPFSKAIEQFQHPVWQKGLLYVRDNNLIDKH